MNLENFFVAENLNSFFTLIVGLFAFVVYQWQKIDKKTNTARLILSEVRNAEKKVEKLSELVQRGVQDLPLILPKNSWKDNSFLLASDFDQDELADLNHFFGVCENLDEYVRRDNEYFWITTQNRAEIAQEMLSKFIESSYEENKGKVNEAKLEKMIEHVLTKYVNHPYSYSPSKTINELKKLLEQYQKITTTTTGSKLKKIARVN